jgi:hypothetical protein
LYALWIRRAIRLHGFGQFDRAWLDVAAEAFSGRERPPRSLTNELFWHLPAVAAATIAERRALLGMRFRVAGLAAINHSLFR